MKTAGLEGHDVRILGLKYEFIGDLTVSFSNKYVILGNHFIINWLSYCFRACQHVKAFTR
jgi:hypothetical protein